MQTFFVEIKCKLGKTYSVASALADREIASEIYSTAGNYDILAKFHLDDGEAARLSPLLWPAPAGRTLDAVVGAEESGEYLRQGRALAEAWGAAGVRTRFEALPGANHFTVVAPLADPDSAMTRRLAEVAQGAR